MSFDKKYVYLWAHLGSRIDGVLMHRHWQSWLDSVIQDYNIILFVVKAYVVGSGRGKSEAFRM
jgi:hypothetical protein